MTVDLRGLNTVNKGAQLMLEAIVENLGNEFLLSARPHATAFESRAKLGLRQTIDSKRFPRLAASLSNRIPRGVAADFGFTRSRDISGVVDGSGYKYAEGLSQSGIRFEATLAQAWRKRGLPRVMLPQAFGPFDNLVTRRLSRQVLDSASIVFVRDRVSEGYLRTLGLSVPIERYPDFTVPLAPATMSRVLDVDFAAIVPNSRMVSTGALTSNAYIELLSRYGESVRAIGLEPLLVVHEEKDAGLATRAAEAIDAPSFMHDDPRVLKAVLQQARLTIASRFHAVVGSLAVGTPTIVLGWTHKYAELLDDFGVPGWLVRTDQETGDLVARIANDEASLATARERKSEMVERTNEMWSKTKDALRSTS